MLQTHVGTFTDDAGIAGDGRPYQAGAQRKNRFAVELGSEPLFRQLHAVALHAGEANLQRNALRAHGLDLNGLAWWLWRTNDGLGREVERDAKNVGIFDVEKALLIQIVGGKILNGSCPVAIFRLPKQNSFKLGAL